MSQPQHTVFAGKAVGLAELFKYTVGKSRLDGPVIYRPEMAAPDGPSTAGGKQGVQHVSLVPEGGGATLVVGSAHLVEQQAELRTFHHVDEMHRRRFKGAPFGVPKNVYDAFFFQLQGFFAERGFRVTVTDAPPAEAVAPQAAPAPATPTRLVVTIAVTALVVAAIGVFLLVR